MLSNQNVPLKCVATYTASCMSKSVRISVCLAMLLFACLDTGESSETIVKSNVSYTSVTGLDFVEADKKLVYGDANPELQYGLLWLPESSTPNKNPPLIVLIHGGCWLNAFDIQHSYPLSSALAQAGYAVWSLEYLMALFIHKHGFNPLIKMTGVVPGNSEHQIDNPDIGWHWHGVLISRHYSNKTLKL